MQPLLQDIAGCTVCKNILPHPPRPVVQASPTCQLVIVGQAPGRRVHESGIPWNDPSGDRLRKWLQMDKATFYDASKIALIPTAFCYPGTGKNGDLPPPAICAPTWHGKLWAQMPEVKLTLLIGKYAQNYYLKNTSKQSLTATVKNYCHFLPHFLPLPHPSPRNIAWFKKNAWFETEVLEVLRIRLKEVFEG